MAWSPSGAAPYPPDMLMRTMSGRLSGSAAQHARDVAAKAGAAAAAPPTEKLRHVVLFRFKEKVDREATAQLFAEGLRALPAKMPEVVGAEFVFGPDGGVGGEGNHDFVLVADFPSAQAYKTYAEHPAHREFVETVVKPHLARDGRSAIQYRI
eukprot:m.82884 g.82884  ORF g.82884 m.82884 type:complete len:153 (-) comp11150_c1_seq2:32-490(-)